MDRAIRPRGRPLLIHRLALQRQCAGPALPKNNIKRGGSMANTLESSKGDGAPRIDVKHEVAQRLIEAMEKGGAPWQRPPF